jgi:SAM-dependent methyltransferase
MKSWARRSKTLIIAAKIYQNWLMRRRFAAGVIETEHGSSHRSKSLIESLSYIEEQFDDYLRYSGLTPEQLQGKQVLELGFGDNVGVALKFLASGAARIVCVDKFYSSRNPEREREIYLALRERLSGTEQLRFDEVIDLREGVKFDETRLRVINGLELEQAATILTNEGVAFDIIVSRAVIEEIFEPGQVFRAADRVLVPGGLSLHKIDLSDYGIFADGGMHPLTFLTIPDWVYRQMATDSGIPNRKLIGYYKKEMDKLGYSARFLVTGIVGRAPVVPHKEQVELGSDYTMETLKLIEGIRPRLCNQYRDLKAEELMISGIFLVARKPMS